MRNETIRMITGPAAGSGERPRVGGFRTPRLLVLLLAGVMAGCQGSGETAVVAEPPPAPTTPPANWESKSRSVLASDQEEKRLVQTASIDPAAAAKLREAAIELLRKASDSSNPLLRKHAVEALQSAPEHLVGAVRLALGDSNPGVRFAGAMTVGNQRLSSLALLVEPLIDDPSLSVQASAIYALRRCGRPVSPTPLASMINSDDPEVKGNAVWVLGMLGEASAMPMLREALRTPVKGSEVRRQIVDLQIAEAMVRLGKRDEIELIRAALFRPADQAEIIAFACQLCGELNDDLAVPTLKDLARRTGRQEEPAEVRLAATLALARIAPHPVLREIPAAYIASDLYELRAQAAATLGWIPDPEVRSALVALMGDPNTMVQVAAAGAVLRSTQTLQAATVGGDGPEGNRSPY